MGSKKVGLLGGTFNPIHNGHLLLAEEAWSSLRLDVVQFVPNRIPPHRSSKQDRLASDKHRYKMCLLATQSNSHFEVLRIELDRSDVSYTYDTVLTMKQQHPHHDYFFICGAECVLRHSWHKFSELLELLTGLVLTARQGEGVQAVEMKIKQESPQFLGKIMGIQMPSFEISATEIRRRIKKGESIRYLVPERVEAYIQTHQLYRS